MPSIAQKLCHEIVEPDIKILIENKKNITLGKTHTASNLKKNGKSSQNVRFEKKKVLTEPQSVTSTNKCVFKSSKTVCKNLTNSGVNTLISGPLKCNHNCLTLIHRRVNKSDKACTHHIDTVSCGTQFFNNINGILKQGKSSKCNIKEINIKNNEVHSSRSNIAKCRFSIENTKFYLEKPCDLQPPCLRYASGKHWALSNYTTRGPDF